MQKSGLWPAFAAAFILILQFATIPGLGDPYNAGKLYLLSIAVLTGAFCLSVLRSELVVPPVAALFGLLWLIFFISAWQSLEPGWALLQVAILAIFVLVLWMTTQMSARGPAFAACLIDALVFFGVVAALLGLYEYVHFQCFGPTRSMLIPYLLPPDLLVRVGGVYGQPNQLALFLSVSLLAFFYRYIHRRPAFSTRGLARLRFIPVALVAAVFFLTLSRSGLLSFCLIFGFLTWLVVSRRYIAGNPAERREFFCLLLTMAAAFLAVKGLAWTSPPELKMVRSLGDTGINPSGRFVFWMSAVLIFLDNPWLGVGLDHYKNWMNGYGPLSHEALGFVPYEAMKSTNWAHNDLLQILCEGGIFAFLIVLLLLGLFLWQMWKNLVRDKNISDPFFLYAHLFLLPFVIQSMFEWPLRSPPLLVLFFVCTGLLLSFYPLKQIRFSLWGKRSVQLILVSGLCLAGFLLHLELQIGSFKREFTSGKPVENTLDTFASLADHPYSSYRVLTGALPGYLRIALSRKDDYLAREILPFYERLSTLEGARWQWYDLARLYLKLGREAESRVAVERAIELMPLDTRTWALLHYLNMLKASRETGRPLDSFWPQGQKVDFSKLELTDD